MSQITTVKPVAVVGISAEFPSGPLSGVNFDHQSFFDFLLAGEEASEKVPQERFNIDGWQGTHIGQVLPEKACFLKDVTSFDHFEFGITAKDAVSMAVGTRKLIEHSFLALLDSGINSRSQNVGAYTSGVAFDILSAADADEWDARDAFGGGTAALANRVSYHLDLTGPSLPVDTACSSSLMALHLAIQGLRSGDCEAALVGGSQINHRFVDWVWYSQASILSPSGQSRPFDASADGFGRGEAVVVIVVKLLEDAIRDGDKIYATILNTAINSTGSAGPVKTPIADSQAAVMYKSYEGTGRSPKEVDYVECHSTGTSVGDPVEVNWVGAHFKREKELLVGSVKANIGHTEITAFLASLSKVCCMFKAGLIPPQVGVTTLNPAIGWTEYNMRPNTKVEPLTASSPSGASLVSVNASGLGGANGHCVVESFPYPPRSAPEPLPADMSILLIAGGLSPRTATAIASDVTQLATEIPRELSVLSTVSGRRSRQMTWRTAAVSSADHPFVFPQPRFVPRTTPPIAFVFSGQGPQHVEMGRQLFGTYPVFRESILRMDKVHIELTGTSVVQDLGFFSDLPPKNPLPDVWPVTTLVPALNMTQIALFDLLVSMGIRPDLVFGHSAGESAMFYASGATSLELAMEISVRRARAMAHVDNSGGMAAVSCSSSVAREIIDLALNEAGPDDVLELGCFNAPEAVAISGHHVMLDKAIAIAQSRGLWARKVKTRTAGHSSLLDPCRTQYIEEMEEAFARHPVSYTPTIPTYSSQTGTRWDTAFTTEYMWRNTRVPVKFEQTVTAVLKEVPEAIFIEISPHPALSSYIAGMGAKADKVLCPMRRTKTPGTFNEVSELLQTVGALSCLGVNTIDFHAVNGTTALELSKPLPAYPFVPKVLPMYSENSRMAHKQKRVRKGPLNYEGVAINSLTHPDLAQHVVRGEPILPATGFFEMIFEEGARTIWDIELLGMLPLLPEKVLQVEIKTDGHAWSVSSSSGGRNPRLHATGFMTTEVTDNDLGPLDLTAIRARCERSDITNLYTGINASIAFGPLYRRVQGCLESENEMLFEIRGNGPDLTEHHKYIFNPALLDSCIHGIIHPVFTGNADRNVYFLPSHIGRVILYDAAIEKELPETIYCHVITHDWSPEDQHCDCYIVNEHGERLVTLMDCVASKHWNIAVPTLPETNYDLLYQPLGLPEDTLPVQHNVQVIDHSFLDVLLPFDEKPNGLANGITHQLSNDISNHVELDMENSEEGKFRKFTDGFMSGSSSEVKPSRVFELFASSFDPFVVETRHILEHALKAGKRIVRILEIGDASATLASRLLPIFAEYPTLRVDYTAAGHEKTATLDVRTISFDISSPSHTQSLPSFTYDAIISIHSLAFASNTQRSVELLHELLVPGGFLLALEVNGDPGVPGTRWIERVFSPHHDWSGIRDGKLHGPKPLGAWKESVQRAGFKYVSANPDDVRSLFVTLKAQKGWLPTLSESAEIHDADEPMMVNFKLANALDLQSTVLAATTSASGGRTALWIEATMGSFDGSAAMGFTRSLRRELVSVDVNLVLFDPVWKDASKAVLIQQLSTFPYLEPEIAIDSAGVVLVPRLCSFPPRRPSTFDPSRYWVVEKSGIVAQPALPLPVARQILIELSSISDVEGGLRGIVGTIARTSSSKWPVGTRVVAVVESTASNYAVVHEGQACHLPGDCDPGKGARIALPLILSTLALGLGLSRPLESLETARIVVLQSGAMSIEISQLLKRLGLNPDSISASVPIELPRLDKGDIVICGLPQDVARTIPSIPGVSVYNWLDTESGGLASIVRNPWFVGSTLKTYLERVISDIATNISSQTPDKLLPTTPQVSSTVSLRPDRYYLIVGGIGSLGLQMAIWMYGKGARHIILTSRRGEDTLRGIKARSLRGPVEYLRSLPDLELRLEACDASSQDAFDKLVASLDRPLAGCILSAVLIFDRLFLKQDSETFAVPFKGKTEAFWVIEKAIAIEKLDFFIAITSVSGFGAAGQTNYSSANTAVEYLMSQYPNAWSFAAPGISDSNVGIYSFTAEASHLEMWESSAMSSYEICLCLEDGLLRMAYSPMKLYIPNLDWDALHNSVSDSTLYNHLVKYDASREEVEVEDPAELLQEMVLKFIDISADEFEHFVPLTSYGLDSLSAARLSTALKPYMSITQIQLLGDLSLDDLVAKMRDAKRSGTDPITTNGPATATNPTNSTEAPFAWDSLHQPGHNVLKLVISTGTPLILIHGGAGDITAFRAIQEQFSTPLWAIQPTPETPMDSVEVLAKYYFGKIKEKRPAGPYRIAGFSASSLVTLRLAEILLENGDEIVQLTFVDHFPMLFASPLHDFNTTPESFEELGHLAALKTVDMISDSCARDKTAARRAYGLALVSASQNLPSTPTALESWTFIRKIAVMNLRQAIAFSGGFEVWSGLSPAEREERMRVRMIEEVRSVGRRLSACRMSAYVADWGLRTLMPDDWNDFGVGRCFGDGRLGDPRAGVDERKAKVYRYPAGHFDIFERSDFSRSLEVDWVDAAIEAGAESEYEWKSMVHHPLKDDLTTMFRILDTMALKYMKESIEQNPVVDSEISRQRLYRETLEYLRTRKPAIWTEEEYTRLKSIYPLYFETTERIGSVHASTFQSPTAAVAALYADNMIDGWYLNNPGFMPINIEATKRFKSLVSSPSFRARSGSEPLRVLEVGAGVGGLTTFLVETLADLQHSNTQSINVEYTITDLSYSLAASLASSFSIPSPSSSPSTTTSRPKNNITLLAKQYDVSKPPSSQSQSFPLGSYDIITALNVIHAVPDLNETLKGLYALLKPGGKLLVVDSDGKAYRDHIQLPLRDPRTARVVFEPAKEEENENENAAPVPVPVLETVPRPGAIWADFVWGSFQGWFGFTDDRAHCTVDGEEWRARLEGEEVGFEVGSVRVVEEDVGICILLEAGKA